MRRLIIAGGGIAGLAAAWAARRAARAGVEITLLERDPHPGGKIRSERRDGCLLDAGPDSFLTRKPAALRLSEELGIGGRLLARTERAVPASVMRAHALYPLPQGFSGMVPTDLQALAESPLLSEAGRRRALEEPSIPAHPVDADISVAQFMRGRFGTEAFDLFIEPLVSGIYGADAEVLSLEATFPHLRALERRYGSLTTAFQETRRPPVDDAGPARPGGSGAGSAAPPPFMSFADGMGELVGALCERLDDITVRCGESVAAVSRRGSGFRVALAGGEVAEADAVILALPANVTSPVTRPLSPALSAATGLIPFSSSAVVHMAWPRHEVDHPLDGYGYLVPAVEESLILGCTWSSSKWKGRAPDGTVLMRMNVGRFGRAEVGDMNETELLRLCREEASLTMGIAAEPLVTRVHRWSRAMPQYTRDHPRTISAIERALADCPGVYLAGCSYRGVGISDCIDSGESAASRALAFLSRGGTVHD